MELEGITWWWEWMGGGGQVSLAKSPSESSFCPSSQGVHQTSRAHHKPLRFGVPAWLSPSLRLLQNPKGGRMAETVLKGNGMDEFLQKPMLKTETKSGVRLNRQLNSFHAGALFRNSLKPLRASDLPVVNTDLRFPAKPLPITLSNSTDIQQN